MFFPGVEVARGGDGQLGGFAFGSRNKIAVVEGPLGVGHHIEAILAFNDARILQPPGHSESCSPSLVG